MPTDSLETNIISVDQSCVELVVPLFDAYRTWYGESSDVDGARNFLTHRLRNNESVILLAVAEEQPVGFTQLYPLFSSISMAPIWLLNDLFVDEAFRGRGVGTLLLEAATEFARQTDAGRIELETEISNTLAQKLYERLGWRRNSTHLFYSLEIE